MSMRSLVLVGLMTCSMTAWGANSKANLERARSNYQQAVAHHGSNSPEAQKARQHLRSARRSYHAENRRRARGVRAGG